MNNVTLSIIIPVYNVEAYLRRCLNSILKQNTLIDYEIILVNDGSTDTSGRICDDFKSHFPNIQVKHIKNSGVAVARNLGIALSNGKFLYFVDPDDYLTESFFIELAPYINDNWDVLCFGFNEVKEKLGINSDNARYIKNKINKVFADFSNLEDLKQVQFEWFKKPNHRYEYGIHIKIEGGAMVQQNEMIIENTWREVKEDLLKKMLLDAFKRRYPEKAYLPIPELREEYIKWLKNEQIDIDSKKTAYVDYMKNTNTKDMAQKLAFFVDGFPKELSKNYQKYI